MLGSTHYELDSDILPHIEWNLTPIRYCSTRGRISQYDPIEIRADYKFQVQIGVQIKNPPRSGWFSVVESGFGPPLLLVLLIILLCPRHFTVKTDKGPAVNSLQ